MHRRLERTASVLCCTAVAVLATACTPAYSPDTYASNAAQQAAKVDQGVVVGVRDVSISADTTLGTTTGAAAGGILGSQVGEGTAGALGAVGGTVAGGVVGNVVSHAAGDTDAYEYIVRKANGDLVSVTQKDTTPIEIGVHVLVIQGPQARIVLDYTVPLPGQAADAGKGKPAEPPPTAPLQPESHPQSTGTAAAPAVTPSPPPIATTPLPAPAPTPAVQAATPAPVTTPAVQATAPASAPAPAAQAAAPASAPAPQTTAPAAQPQAGADQKAAPSDGAPKPPDSPALAAPNGS